MLVVYDNSESVCCHKILIALHEKAVPYERRAVALERGEQAKPEFLAINPKGLVPAFVHNNRVITESTIMLEYLEDEFPDPPLMPKDAYWRARRRLWARRIDDGMHVPHISTISFAVAFNKVFRQSLDTQEKLERFFNAQPEKGRREHTRVLLNTDLKSDGFRDSLLAYDAFIGDMEKQLKETAWLAGDAFSLADIDVIPYLWRLRNLQFTGMWAERPLVASWFDRVTSRASFDVVRGGQESVWLDVMMATGAEAWPIAKALLATRPAT